MSVIQLESPPAKVLVLRTCAADLTSYNGFTWPQSGRVCAPDWEPVPKCGHGLHGLLWGVGDYSLLRLSDPFARWLVVEVDAARVVDLDDKVKFPEGDVLYCGDMPGAQAFLAERRREYSLRFATAGYQAPASTTGNRPPASTTGNRAPASTTGNRAPASTAGNQAPASTTGKHAPASTTGNQAPASTAGYQAPASTTGDEAPASTAGYQAPASTTGKHAPASTTGNRAPASTTGDEAPASTTGYRAPASTAGDRSVACCLGLDGQASAGANGSIILTWWDGNRFRHVVGYVGEEGLVAGQDYKVEDGRIVPAASN